jgi:hypothetical protein
MGNKAKHDPVSRAVVVVEADVDTQGTVQLPVSIGPAGQYPTNFDLTTWEGKAAVLAALNPGDLELGPDGSVGFVAVHFLIFPDTGVDPDTGEVKEFTRTALFTADGRVYRTTSAYAPARVMMAMRLFTEQEWANGIPFLVRERKSRKTGRTYHDIRVSRLPVAKE